MQPRYVLGNNIQRRLDEIGKTPEWLAERTNKAVDTIIRYITGATVPKAIALWKIAKAMDCTMDSLMEGIGSDTD